MNDEILEHVGGIAPTKRKLVDDMSDIIKGLWNVRKVAHRNLENLKDDLNEITERLADASRILREIGWNLDTEDDLESMDRAVSTEEEP